LIAKELPKHCHQSILQGNALFLSPYFIQKAKDFKALQLQHTMSNAIFGHGLVVAVCSIFRTDIVEEGI